MKAVAFIELLIMARVLLGALLLRNSIMSPLFYAHFLRQRYYQSLFTRNAVHTVGARVDGYAKAPGTPPVAAQVWDKVKFFLEKWGGSTLAPQQPAGGAAPAARAQ